MACLRETSNKSTVFPRGGSELEWVTESHTQAKHVKFVAGLSETSHKTVVDWTPQKHANLWPALLLKPATNQFPTLTTPFDFVAGFLVLDVKRTATWSWDTTCNGRLKTKCANLQRQSGRTRLKGDGEGKADKQPLIILGNRAGIAGTTSTTLPQRRKTTTEIT